VPDKFRQRRRIIMAAESFRTPIVRTWTTALRRIDWRRRDVMDAVVMTVLFLVAYLVAERYDLPPRLLQFALDHQDWELDDAIFVVTVLSVASVIYVLRRWQDLAREIAARRRAEAESNRLARHDQLTGLPNRRFLAEKLDEVLREAAPGNARIAVLMLDLDGFKAVNDAHGHAAGDDALVEFAVRAASVLRADTFMARVGGDEFAIVMPTDDLDTPLRLAHRVVAAVSKPILVNGVSVSLAVGVGIAVAPDNGTTRAEVLRRADLALYRAKSEGRSFIRFFEADMDRHAERRALVERELRAAIAADALDVVYQPLVDLAGDRIVGFEALARWSSPSLGPLPPSEFIAVAEESGLMVDLGAKLLRRACRDAIRWPRDVTLSFNLSAIELRDPMLGLRVMSILGDTGLDPRRLELEVTETALIGDAEVAHCAIDALRATGVRISLDDFGVGHADLSQLLSRRFDKIKIDRSFIDRIGKDPHSGVIVQTTIGLAKVLGLATAAEGVETDAQLASLRREGCVLGQGFLFGEGVPAERIPDMLARHGAGRAAA
jgi:diguanylate cyclase (GGDEF)-like protein